MTTIFDTWAETHNAKINELKEELAEPLKNVLKVFSRYYYDKRPAIENILDVANLLDAASDKNNSLLADIKSNSDLKVLTAYSPKTLTDDVGIEEALTAVRDLLRSKSFEAAGSLTATLADSNLMSFITAIANTPHNQHARA